MPIVIPINYSAIVAAAAASIVLGFLWYGPLFGKPWIHIMGFTEESIKQQKEKGMAGTFALMIIGSLVMAYVLAHALVFASAYLNMTGAQAGLMGGFFNWLGFIAPVTMGAQLWEGKPWKLFLISAGYYLVSLLVMGVILATWVV